MVQSTLAERTTAFSIVAWWGMAFRASLYAVVSAGRVGRVGQVAQSLGVRLAHAGESASEVVLRDACRHFVVPVLSAVSEPSPTAAARLYWVGSCLSGVSSDEWYHMSGQVMNMTAGMPCCMYVTWSLEP